MRKKTSVYLEPELDIGLARVAWVKGVTKAELIRSALWQVVEENPPPPITAIGIEPDPTPSELSAEDRDIANSLEAEYANMTLRDTDTSTGPEVG